ncbi:DUF2264 domain-containing protein [Cellulophaga omnivescoria]|uniref:DUF2264 domain-containing protein n=1 Tax=Cellulophaga omnivescoria TaxID=1888890 RepID=UPI000985A6AD|nr:DUF2264 domain-containing protein [Cellulophaga omnivescoria]WBU90701.1 DUF2264 domain-containing protein [Cellulophaga omnivescoria]
MLRRKFITAMSLSGIITFIKPQSISAKSHKHKAKSGDKDRAYWCNLLFKISYPVFSNLANETLAKNMPATKSPTYDGRKNVTYLEAVARTAAGIAPWLSLPDDESKEGKMRKKLRSVFLKGMVNAVNPSSPDYLNFRTEKQPIVDAGHLVQAFLRAPKQLWEPLDEITKKRFVEELKALRTRKAYKNNWLLCRAITEIFLLSIDENWEKKYVDEALDYYKDWYIGDGWYKDGVKFSFNYYNSFVMHSMLVDTLNVLVKKGLTKEEEYDLSLKRMIRFAVQLERMISPEGTYPVIGRSITYRTGAFQTLSHVSLLKKLPTKIKPAQVRCALTAIKKNLFIDDVFDKDGWLELGFRGNQPELADYYTSRGSLYMTTLSFLPLGLNKTDKFWSGKDEDWTSKKAWNSKPFEKDFQVQY